MVLRFTPPANSAAEAFCATTGVSFARCKSIRLRLNLHGATLGIGQRRDESALYLDQNGWRYVALAAYVHQRSNQWQIITIPLNAFVGADNARFNRAAPFSRIGFRFWMVKGGAMIDVHDLACI